MHVGTVVQYHLAVLLDGRVHRLSSLPKYNIHEIMQHMDMLGVAKARDFRIWKTENWRSNQSDPAKTTEYTPWWQSVSNIGGQSSSRDESTHTIIHSTEWRRHVQPKSRKDWLC